jgi:hypothetical protein
LACDPGVPAPLQHQGVRINLAIGVPHLNDVESFGAQHLGGALREFVDTAAVQHLNLRGSPPDRGVPERP